MAKRIITGAYPAGYDLDPDFQRLEITGSATVGGSGVTVSDTQRSIIENTGRVQGTANGITLSDGGSVTNGTAARSTALIQGTTAIRGDQAFVTVINDGTITSDTTTSGYSYQITPSIVLTAGGKVSNAASSAVISNGVSISGARGFVINFGSIGYNADGYLNPTRSYHRFYGGPSILMTAGGGVVNGGSGNTSASISSGVQISGGAGTVVNDGRIDGPYTDFGTYSGQPEMGDFGSSATGPSVVLLAGGRVTNGTDGNTAATITNGVSISGGVGTVTNEGTIGGTVRGSYSYGESAGSFGSSIALMEGGTVVNGSDTNREARIETGIRIGDAVGRVDNFGAIGANSTESYSLRDGSKITIFPSIVMSQGGTVINGSATDTAAIIRNGVDILGGLGTVTNFGTIGGPTAGSSAAAVRLRSGGLLVNGVPTNRKAMISGSVGVFAQGASTVRNFGTISSTDGATGTAVRLNSRDAVLIEEASGRLEGSVVGGGGTLVLGSEAGAGTIGGLGTQITGFASVEVQAGARWRLAGVNTIAAGTTLSNPSALLVDGTLTNAGSIMLSGPLQLATRANLVNDRTGRLVLTDDAPISNAGGATGTSVLNSGLLQKSGGDRTSRVGVNLSSTGRIVVASGTLSLSGANNLIAGSVSGAGRIDFYRGTTTLAEGTSITAAALTVTGGATLSVATSFRYTYAFTGAAGSVLSIASDRMVSLGGDTRLSGSTIEGAGRFATGAATRLTGVTVAGSATWVNTGVITAMGDLMLAGATSFLNRAGAALDLSGDIGIAAGPSDGSHLTNAGTLAKTAGDGTSTIAVGLTNTGVIEAGRGTLALLRQIGGNGGTLKVEEDATLEFDAAVSAGQTAMFAGSDATLMLNAARDFHATVAGLVAGDTIDLGHFAAGGAQPTYMANASDTGGVLSIGTGANQVSLLLSGSYMASAFHASSDGHSGTAITYGTSPMV